MGLQALARDDTASKGAMRVALAFLVAIALLVAVTLLFMVAFAR